MTSVERLACHPLDHHQALPEEIWQSLSTEENLHHLPLPRQAALQEGLVPDDETLITMAETPGFVGGNRKLEDLRWPDEPLRTALLRRMGEGGWMGGGLYTSCSSLHMHSRLTYVGWA